MTKTDYRGAHIPVMLDAVLAALAPRDRETFVDATFGAGGYSRAILTTADCRVIGLDRDPRAIAAASAHTDTFGGRLSLVETPFAKMDDALGTDKTGSIDGIVFDLGVSSMQLDEADRGFSFRLEGPLSMRMDGARPDASDVVNVASANDLRLIFKAYGEEKRAGKLADAIIVARDAAPITTTRRLADIIEAASPPVYASAGRKSRQKSGPRTIHPATRVFQALRIFVNDELGQLAEGLCAAEKLLKPSGRLVVVTFHSLEARIVKRFFADRTVGLETRSRHAPALNVPPATFTVPNRGQEAASRAEADDNPRARSASLRWGRRTSLPARETGLGFAGLPNLSFSPELLRLKDS
ncbi:MAG: 16S rRNA (cytosine(1402)-N(4))-methyltransferase RsmH [Pseudomonadota bacterium]